MTLGQKLWVVIEKPQGYSFIADSIQDMADNEVIERAKIALKWEKECVTILQEFIKENK